MSKITTLKELRREIAEKLQFYSSTGPSILKLIDDFEAGLKDELSDVITLLDDLLWAVECEPSHHLALTKSVEEMTKKLHRLLGDEKEKGG